MTSHTDSELLEKFVTEDDNLALSSLIKRHVNVAYSSVISMPGGADLADEACQLTFIELAKKAHSLKTKHSLAGWIFQTTRNQARNLRRQEARRREREKSYMKESVREESASPLQKDLLKYVMETLDKLRKKDRDLVVLRYLEGKTFVSIANTMDCSVDGARMRVKRALHRMNQILRKKGVSSSATLIATVISSHGAQQAPQALISNILQTTSIASTSLATGNIAGGISLIFMKQKVATATVLIAFGATGYSIYQSERKTSEKTERKAPSAN